MGAVGAGYWIAHVAFWILIVLAGVELGRRPAAIFAGLWLVGYAGSAGLAQGTTLFMAYVAALDVALVLVVFKGDIRLT